MSHLNQGWTYHDRIDKRSQGTTLLDYYTQRYDHSSRQQWRDRIESGTISVDNMVTTNPEMLLSSGAIVSYARSPWVEPDVPFDVKILQEDNHLLIVHKPSGLPVLPGGGFLDNTLCGWLRREYAEPPTPIHRLGRGTSGVMVLAKTNLARSRLSQDFRDRSLQKIYRALAVGIATIDSFSVTVPIGKVDYPQLGYLYMATETGKDAISHCKVIERRTDTTLFEVTIPTGRPHQIRIHLAAAGYPLVGDPLYGIGGTAIDQTSVPGDCGYHLHAHRVIFRHPIDRSTIEVTAEPPELLRLESDRFPN